MSCNLIIITHLLPLTLCFFIPANCIMPTRDNSIKRGDLLLTPEHTSQPLTPNKEQNNQPNTTDVSIKAKDNLFNNKDTSTSDNTSQAESHGLFGKFLCNILRIKSYCPALEKANINDDKKIDLNNVIATPVESKNCFEYGKPGVVPSDWTNAEKLGWVVVNEFGVNRFTTNKPAIMGSSSNLLLNNLECNAATYEILIKLGPDSVGGLVFRASTDEEMVVVLNALTKTVTLSKHQNGGYQILYEKSHQGINSQFLHKLSVIDSGYKGQVQVSLDGQVVMEVPKLFFKSSGGFGLHVEKGNVSFSEASVEPL